MTKFVLLAQAEDGTGPQPGTAEHDREMQQWEEVNHELASRGVLVGAWALNPRVDAASPTDPDEHAPEPATDRATGRGDTFAIYVVEADSRADALAWARRMPVAEYGSVEVREVLSGGSS
jgi:hypothetical protein